MNELCTFNDTVSATELDTTALNVLVDSGSLNISKDELMNILEKSKDTSVVIANAFRQ